MIFTVLIGRMCAPEKLGAGLRLFFIKEETLAQVLSCEFCKIFNNTFFTEHLRTTPTALRTVH